MCREKQSCAYNKDILTSVEELVLLTISADFEVERTRCTRVESSCCHPDTYNNICAYVIYMYSECVHVCVVSAVVLAIRKSR